MRMGTHLDDNYFGGGILIGLIFVGITAILCSFGFIMTSDSAETEFGLYKALENKTLWEYGDEKPERPTVIIPHATIRAMALTENKNEALKLLTDLRSFSDGERYERIFLHNRENITKLVQGETENLSAQVSFPSPINYILIFFGLAWLVMALLVTINFVAQSICESESLFHVPWKNPWTYGLMALMLPCILPCFAMEGSVRGIIFLIEILRRVNREEREEHHKEEYKTAAVSPEEVEARNRQVKEEEKRRREEEKKRQEEALENRIICGRQNAQMHIRRAHERMVQTQELWKNVFTEYLTKRTHALQGQIASHRSNLQSLGETITKEQKELALAQDELKQWNEGLEAIKHKKSEEYIQELHRILNLQHVKAIEIEDRTLRVFTDTLYIIYGGNRYEIGMFEIAIRLGATNVDGISLKNFSSTHPFGTPHPYARENAICWGAIADPISNMIRQKEYAVAIDFILQALQSAEGDNPSYVKQWRQIS